ncbi:uncharacterized protein E5676_scaffold228G00460 [Cucumis melo var. makuwa]|uniref:Uncharacterized protein n=1 Tax=Cucumis melo var. makuwa TaxID=1194695 RepID=A0A5D3DA57_CUCMM|nr:uncharacterized protein E6C27_scaffold125G002170 [Cucumis melo var. makuwa]TYK20350.1 uncharacterized protein E5676_scaffold228G00460 [Cucumis melo var. makuwa]
MNERSEEKTKPSLEVPPKLELKALPTQLKYAYLGVDNNLDEKSLLDVLRWHRKVLGWTLAYIRGISPSYNMHKIRLDEGYAGALQFNANLIQQ